MSDSLVKGNGLALAVTTGFQLLDPSTIYGATSFYYDFYLKGANVDADAIWQIDSEGFVDMTRGIGVTGLGDEEWLKGVEIDVASAGSVQIDVVAGAVDYWYAVNGGTSGGGYPVSLEVNGATSATTEFYVQKGRIYSVTSDGTHSWEYASDSDAAGWSAFTEGSSNGFSFDSPPSGRIRVVPTGAVNFSITSKKH